MRRTVHYLYRIFLLLLVLVVVTTGCQPQTTAEAIGATPEATVYTGALRTDYADALDVTSQLALGVLRLEDTPNAVTVEQAVQALPLWKTLQGTMVTTQAEKLALTKQLEGMLTAPQLAAITAMQLTNADAQAWLQEQGPMAGAQGRQLPTGGAAPSGAAGPAMSEADRAAMRERFENMTAEERANMQAQFGQGGRGAAGGASADTARGAMGGTSVFLLRAVVTLLTERSGQTVASVPQPVAEQTTAAEPAATALPVATATPTPEADTPVTIITLAPWKTPEPKVTPTVTPTATQATTTGNLSSPTSPSSGNLPSPTSLPSGGTSAALVQKPDTDPAPPLTIEITTNTAEPNPLLEGTLIYRVAGFVHNPTQETYALTAVHVTFFDADGFRGAFYPFPNNRGGKPSGEYITHGRMQADFGCALLGPGESCPFVAELAGQNMASFLVHPDAVVAEWHESVGVTLSNAKVADTGTNYLRISGTATNPNEYAIKNVTISALLLDSTGQMVSMGTGVVTYLEAGASTTFEVYVAKKAYATYQLLTRAEQSVN